MLSAISNEWIHHFGGRLVDFASESFADKKNVNRDINQPTTVESVRLLQCLQCLQFNGHICCYRSTVHALSALLDNRGHNFGSRDFTSNSSSEEENAMKS